MLAVSSSGSRVRPSPKLAPLLLAQICGDWRAVAISIPELWNSIHLNFLPRVRYDGILVPAPVTVVQLSDSWFTRAAGLPLSITIYSDLVPLPEGLIALIVAKSPQWGRLELQILPADLAAFDHPGPFPMLQTVAINTGNVRDLRWNRNMACCAPNLQALRLGPRLWRAFRLEMAPGPLASVTALDFCLDGVTVSPDFFTPLGHFPNLRLLNISSRLIRYTDLCFVVAIPLVETLLVKHSPILLNHLQLPTLRHLDVLLFEDMDTTYITSFLTRSACILTHLTLRAPGGDRWCEYFRLPETPCNLSLLLECLKAVPLVVNMSLTGDEALYSIFHRGDILPRLHTLRITSWPSTTVHTAFLAVLRARPALHSAALHLFHYVGEVTPPPNDNVLADLSTHAAGGTHVNLTAQSVGRNWMEFEVNTEECENAEGYDVLAPGCPLPPTFAPFRSKC
ncbi:hypothetical protein B0H16DRAFT_1609575 [Mycena metata]|uniref:F-box domain-containing protein n=1 Tax=Mycena metata TaxID=1033252 RepID=A0AAD7HDI5_9AGAR|nr:hypothetical protein B0H16DRAFT_1609575 [Mycena metata]